MPNIWTHLMFGRELISSWENERPPVEKHASLFHLGCQGPDFLFYHQFLPWQRDRRMNRLGDRMHREHCGPVIVDFFSNVKEMEDGEAKERAWVYFLGFLTHHILDRNFHPYVHCKAGYRKWDHQRFEVILDTMLLQQKRGVSTWNTPVWKEIHIGKELPSAVVAILHRVAGTWYPEVKDLPLSLWNDAYRDMIRAQKLFHDPFGWKRVLTFGRIEPFVYKKKNAPLDYFNEAKAEWIHPADEHKKYSDSVEDLWQQSLKDGQKVIASLLIWLQANEDEEAAAKDAFQQVLGNRSYDTGLDCATGMDTRFSQPIW